MKNHANMTKAELIRRVKALGTDYAARKQTRFVGDPQVGQSQFVPIKESQDVKAALDAHSIVAITDARG